MSEKRSFDLRRYRKEFAAQLAARLSETASFIRSVDMAVNNFPHDRIHDESVLQPPPLAPIPDNLTQLSPTTAETAARLAVLDMIAATEDALRHCWLPFRVVRTLIDEHGFVYYPQWDQAMADEYTKIRRSTFGQVVRSIVQDIRNNGPEFIAQDWQEEAKLLKYVKFRNCLAHRLGYVNEEDVGNAGEILEIEWRDFDVAVDGKVIKRAPKQIEDVKTVEIRKLTRRKSWQLGTRINLGPADTTAIATDLYLRFLNFTSPLMAITAKIGNVANANISAAPEAPSSGEAN
jgi:hypothetical protein